MARLIINEAAFPGERGFLSEADTKACLEQLVLVLERRLRDIPPPYTQRQIAMVTTDDIIDIITAGGVRGQFDGFYRDANGNPAAVPRVEERINNLLRIANQGEPGRFARLLTHANALSAAHVAAMLEITDRHASVTTVHGIPATGGSFAWMMDEVRFHPGGNYLRIEDRQHGSLGGNRFFTLRKVPK